MAVGTGATVTAEGAFEYPSAQSKVRRRRSIVFWFGNTTKWRSRGSHQSEQFETVVVHLQNMTMSSQTQDFSLVFERGEKLKLLMIGQNGLTVNLESVDLVKNCWTSEVEMPVFFLGGGVYDSNLILPERVNVTAGQTKQRILYHKYCAICLINAHKW